MEPINPVTPCATPPPHHHHFHLKHNLELSMISKRPCNVELNVNLSPPDPAIA
jgi:hypothetical protein